MTFYELVRGKTAEGVLAHDLTGESNARGEYLRVAAQVRSNQELVESLKQASQDSGLVSRRIVYLTLALVAAGLLQAFATGWPYVVWWWHHSFSTNLR